MLAARFSQDFLDFLEQLSRAIWFGEHFKSLERFSKFQAIVIEKAADDQNLHFYLFRAQVHGGVVPRQAFDVIADDQQIGRNFLHTIDRAAQIAGGEDGVSFVLQRFREDGTHQRVRSQQENGVLH
jgi:hypothetical protein